MGKDAKVVPLTSVVDKLAKKSGLDKRLKKDKAAIVELQEFSATLFSSILDELLSGKNVKIKNFGQFSVRETKPYARNPGNNVFVKVARPRRLRFSSSVNATIVLNKDSEA